MVAEASPRHSFVRVSRRRRCPECQGDSGCSIRDDGQVVCLRVKSERPCKGKLGGWWHDPKPGAEDAAGSEPARPCSPRPGAEVADADTLHAVYTDLFALCPLSAAHRKILRPLSEEQLRRYGTLPTDRAARRRLLDQLIDRHGFATLLKVPGFALNEKKELDIRGAGIILPARDVQGRIVAVDVRRDVVRDGQSRYYKLSSRSEDGDDGPSPGAPAHIARPASGVADAKTVYITEGIKKADYLADHTGCVTISIPGVGNAPAALSVLEELGGDVAVIALDQDDPAKNEGRTVQAVARAREELAQAAADLGYAARIAQWDPAEAKGVDDLLVARKTFTLQRFTMTAINGDGSRIGSKTQLIGRISEIVHNHSMKAIQKMGMVVATLTLYEAERDPRQTPDEHGRYRVLMCRIADEMGVTRNTASTTIRELANPPFGYLDVKQVENAEDGKTVTWLGLGPKCLSRKDKVAEPPHLARERERNAKRRCPNCGSDQLRSASYICGRCNHTCTGAEAEAAASYMVVREDGRLVDSRTGAYVEPSAEPCTVAVHPPSGEEYDGCTATVQGGVDAGHLMAWSETTFVRSPSASTPVDEVRAHYRRWCRANHEESCPWQVVESWLSESGAHLHHGDRGPVWLGIGLAADTGSDDGVVVDLAARRAERDEEQSPADEGLFPARAGAAESPLFKCSDCRTPIETTYGRCEPCVRAEYALLGLEYPQ